jgi:hypothetical protein
MKTSESYDVWLITNSDETEYIYYDDSDWEFFFSPHITMATTWETKEAAELDIRLNIKPDLSDYYTGEYKVINVVIQYMKVYDAN